jgi:hypothetical protein
VAGIVAGILVEGIASSLQSQCRIFEMRSVRSLLVVVVVGLPGNSHLVAGRPGLVSTVK